MYAIDSFATAASIIILLEPRPLEIFARQGWLCLFRSLTWDDITTRAMVEAEIIAVIHRMLCEEVVVSLLRLVPELGC
jgi:hypothetical protein